MKRPLELSEKVFFIRLATFIVAGISLLILNSPLFFLWGMFVSLFYLYEDFRECDFRGSRE